MYLLDLAIKKAGAIITPALLGMSATRLGLFGQKNFKPTVIGIKEVLFPSVAMLT